MWGEVGFGGGGENGYSFAARIPTNNQPLMGKGGASQANLPIKPQDPAVAAPAATASALFLSSRGIGSGSGAASQGRANNQPLMGKGGASQANLPIKPQDPAVAAPAATASALFLSSRGIGSGSGAASQGRVNNQPLMGKGAASQANLPLTPQGPAVAAPAATAPALFLSSRGIGSGSGTAPSGNGLGVASRGVADGLADLQAGRYADAEQKLQRVIGTDPRNAAAHYYLGYGYYLQSQKEPENKELSRKAAESIAQAFRIDPAFSPTLGKAVQ